MVVAQSPPEQQTQTGAHNRSPPQTDLKQWRISDSVENWSPLPRAAAGHDKNKILLDILLTQIMGVAVAQWFLVLFVLPLNLRQMRFLSLYAVYGRGRYSSRIPYLTALAQVWAQGGRLWDLCHGGRLRVECGVFLASTGLNETSLPLSGERGGLFQALLVGDFREGLE